VDWQPLLGRWLLAGAVSDKLIRFAGEILDKQQDGSSRVQRDHHLSSPPLTRMEHCMASNPKQTVALIDLAVTDGKEIRSSRVEGALRRLDGLTLLEWCIRRLSESTLIDAILVTGPPHYRELISNTGLCNAKWIPSILDSPAQRALELASGLGADWIVFSSPLCPFTDPSLVDRLVSRGWFCISQASEFLFASLGFGG
jgi:hypothetical protein